LLKSGDHDDHLDHYSYAAAVLSSSIKAGWVADCGESLQHRRESWPDVDVGPQTLASISAGQTRTLVHSVFNSLLCVMSIATFLA
jgi:hypothetical protein